VVQQLDLTAVSPTSAETQPRRRADDACADANSEVTERPKLLHEVGVHLAEAFSVLHDTDGGLTLHPARRHPRGRDHHLREHGFAGDSVHATQRHFVQCLRSDLPFESEVVDHLRCVEIIDAAYARRRPARRSRRADAARGVASARHGGCRMTGAAGPSPVVPSRSAKSGASPALSRNCQAPHGTRATRRPYPGTSQVACLDGHGPALG
jgi:hypothetical protein